MLGSDLRHENLNSYHMVGPSLAPYDSDAGNQNFFGTVDPVAAGDPAGLWVGCRMAHTVVSVVDVRRGRAPWSPLPR
jgi:hypothetical protein